MPSESTFCRSDGIFVSFFRLPPLENPLRAALFETKQTPTANRTILIRSQSKSGGKLLNI
ncbi:hypothetical protein [Neisseria polysaccharea]|uniref:hypothetical protein n=1 Tax=Neisseria polysaccharea TaxID=489 RepID=UPI0001D9D9F0|nr:hypothetical protein [Neisseria polysaccharea]EFH22421.1 hypothetical protein NEIPOLOT_01825 [Neisseria polysaccharea ATCC 43768]